MVEARIVGTETKSDSWIQHSAWYLIQLKARVTVENSPIEVQYVVWRSYSDFDKLHDSLCRQVNAMVWKDEASEVMLPKRWFAGLISSTGAEAVIKERKV